MPARKHYWLAKSEPSAYAFEQLVADGTARWDGVRNYEARNNLRAMHADDLVLFYHSNVGLAVVGVARVVREAFQDPTTSEDWSAVEFAPVVALAQPVTLATVRATTALSEMALIKKGRISVTPVTADEFKTVLALGKTKLPR